MKQILRIAALELRLLFFSPIIWLILIFFTLQTGLDFMQRIEGLEAATLAHTSWPDVTAELFKDFWSLVQRNLMFYIPLLTMNIMSREYHQGTIRLLMSSPVRSVEMIIGKYLAMLMIGTLFCLFLAGFVLMSDKVIDQQDNGLMLSALLSVFLLVAAYAAIGIFVSGLTNYQVVAVIGTIAVFYLLDYMPNVWQDKDFFRDITYFMALSRRPYTLSIGLITTRDLVYFCCIIVLFLGYVVLRIDASRKALRTGQRWLRYSAFTVIVLLIGYASSRPTWIGYIDMTANKKFTLTEKSTSVLKKIKTPLKVHVYDNILDNNSYMGYPTSQIGNRNLLSKYQRYLPLIEFDYTYYYDTTRDGRVFDNKVNKGKSLLQIADRVLEGQGFKPDPLLSPVQMRKIRNLDTEEHRLVFELEVGGKRSYLRFYKDQLGIPVEDEITNVLKRLTDCVQTVVFTRGHGERGRNKANDPKSFHTATIENTYRASLINYGFDVKEVNLAVSKIPASTSILVIADPLSDFSAAEQEKIAGYLAAGGNLMVMGEPGRQHILNPLIRSLGVQLMPGQVGQHTTDYGEAFVLAELTRSAVNQDSCYYKPDFARGFRLKMDGAVGVVSSADYGFKMDTLALAPANNSFIRAADGTVQKGKDIPLLVALKRKVGAKEQRILVIGDADFMDNEVLQRWYPVKGNPQTDANFNVYTQSFHWLSGDHLPVYAFPSRMKPLDGKVFSLSQPLYQIYRLWCIWIVPGLLALIGAIILIKRNWK